jgi:hypothetical protein
MKVEAFHFGSITIDGKKFDCDVLVYPDGSVDERKGKLFKHSSHRITKSDLERLTAKGERPEVIIVGLGTGSAASIDADAEEWARDEEIEITAVPSDEAVEKLNRLMEEGDKSSAALIHVTC